MECKCCGESVENDVAKCSVCGFPLLGDIGDKLPQILADYRNKLLSDVSIAVKLYYYGYDSDGELGELKSEYVKVADAPALKPDSILWLDTVFEPPGIKRTVTLDVRVQNSKSVRDKALSADLGKAPSGGRLGVRLGKGCRVRFAVGNQQESILTDSISLLIK